MATWADEIYYAVKAKRDNFVSNGYDDAVSLFNAQSVTDCAYMDIKWDTSSGFIVIIETGQQHNTWSPDQKLKYFPQLSQLIRVASEQNLYP